MCVIVHQDEKAWIDKETARKLWQANPDGGGFAFVDDNDNLQVTKTMKFKSFWSEFEQARSVHGKRDYLLHMRIATHGKVNLENVHPFEVNDDMVMAHNGILHNVLDHLPKDDSVSDTRYFVDHMLPQLDEGWLDRPFMQEMVEEWMGWSKLMFLNTDPTLSETVYRLGNWTEYEGLYLTNDTGLVDEQPKAKGWVGNYYESSEDWNEWMDYKEGLGSQVPEWEVEELLDAIKAERASMFIKHPFVVINEERLQFECTGCLEPIDIETAECGCWDKVCATCWNYVAHCKMEGTCMDINHYDFDALTSAGREKLYGRHQEGTRLELVQGGLSSAPTPEAGNIA